MKQFFLNVTEVIADMNLVNDFCNEHNTNFGWFPKFQVTEFEENVSMTIDMVYNDGTNNILTVTAKGENEFVAGYRCVKTVVEKNMPKYTTTSTTSTSTTSSSN